ncbi:MAG: S8 family peptidase [Bdellovibrionia bacterium]
MDVGRLARVLSIFTLILLTACGGNRSSSSAVPHTTMGCQATAVQGQYIVEWTDGHFSVERAKSREDFIANFVEPRLEKIVLAELDQIVTIKEQPITAEETIPANWGQEVSGAQAAWTQNFRGQNVVIAVIDSGVDPTHPQLRNQLFVNTAETVNGADDDGNGYIDDISGWNYSNPEGPGTPNPLDENGHGTHVSGIIFAEHSAGIVQGVAPQAKLMPLQFMDRTGAGTISRAIQAIDYATKMGVKVINASWGTPGCNRTLESAIANARDKGVLFVTAAGNDYSDLTVSPSFPAAFTATGQLTIGALTYSGFRADFSNFGALVHMVAPGAPVYSTQPAALEPNGYRFMSGTSMAAPFVSGAAALLWSARPNATVAQVREAILTSVAVKDHLNVATHGQLDIAAALAKITSP